MKLSSFIVDDKVKFNSKYIKTKNSNCKLEGKFFNLFKVLYLVKNQAIKLNYHQNREFIRFFGCHY